MAGSAYEYWQRVDVIRGKISLEKLAEVAGLNAASLRNMKSQNRYPKSEASARIASFLGTTTEYLLFGDPSQEPNTPTRTDAIIDKLRTASDMELEMVERILGIGK